MNYSWRFWFSVCELNTRKEWPPNGGMRNMFDWPLFFRSLEWSKTIFIEMAGPAVSSESHTWNAGWSRSFEMFWIFFRTNANEKERNKRPIFYNFNFLSIERQACHILNYYLLFATPPNSHEQIRANRLLSSCTIFSNSTNNILFIYKMTTEWRTRNPTLRKCNPNFLHLFSIASLVQKIYVKYDEALKTGFMLVIYAMIINGV